MDTIGLKPFKYLICRTLQAGACILMLALISGCMGSYGNYNRDSEVFEAFTNDRVPMDYRYYYYHSGSHPIAVIGVEKKYDAGSRMWREVDPDTEKFRDMIKWIWEDASYHRYAARINDPSGQQVGIMYTSIREVAIKFPGENRIVVIPHTPFLWRVEYDESEEVYGSTESSPLPSKNFGNTDSISLPSNRHWAFHP
jgi:hypothetical protein